MVSNVNVFHDIDIILIYQFHWQSLRPYTYLNILHVSIFFEQYKVIMLLILLYYIYE